MAFGTSGPAEIPPVTAVICRIILDARQRSDAVYDKEWSELVEVRGIEPLAPCVQSRCSPAELHPRVARVMAEAGCATSSIAVGYLTVNIASIDRRAQTWNFSPEPTRPSPTRPTLTVILPTCRFW